MRDVTVTREDQRTTMVGSILSFHLKNSRNQTHAIRLGDKHLYGLRSRILHSMPTMKVCFVSGLLAQNKEAQETLLLGSSSL